jgi:hypothetical protein
MMARTIDQHRNQRSRKNNGSFCWHFIPLGVTSPVQTDTNSDDDLPPSFNIPSLLFVPFVDNCHGSFQQTIMGLFAGLVGAFSGFGIALMTNATRKIPLSRGTSMLPCVRFSCLSVVSTTNPHACTTEPWNHVAFTVIGFWAGNYYVKMEKQLVEDINEIRADKGLPPLVGTSHWVRRYQVADSSTSS